MSQLRDLRFRDHTYGIEATGKQTAIWDAEARLIVLRSSEWTDEQLRDVLEAYHDGMEYGRSIGRTALQIDLLRLLGAQPVTYSTPESNQY